MSNLYSVIIPMYNKAKTVMRTVASVLAQSYTNFEVIIVDDGSNDGSYECINEIKDKRVKIIRQSNSGVSAARNKGIALANGDIICFLDADDEWRRDFLYTVEKLINTYPEAVMFCPSYVIRIGRKEALPKWKSVNLNNDCLVKDFFEMASGSNWVMNSSCVAIKKEALLNEDYLFPNEVVYEDFDLWLRIGSRYPVAHSNRVCAVYNRSTTGNVRETMNRKVIYSKTYFHTLKVLMEENKDNPQRLKWINEIIDRRMVVYIFSLLNSRQKDVAKKEISCWKSTRKYAVYKIGLFIATVLPYRILDYVRTIRYKKV